MKYMDYNKLSTYTIDELNEARKKHKITLCITILGFLIVLAIVLYRMIMANKIDWTLLLPMSLTILIYNSLSYRNMLVQELARRTD